MAKWLHSGRRRDICTLLYDAGELRAQSLKNQIESHYDERIDPRSFYATLNSLVESGHLSRRTEGLADVYALTDAGERGVREHYEWFTEQLRGEVARSDETEPETRGDSGGSGHAQTNLKD